MDEGPVGKTELHEALVYAITSPIVAVDRSGTVVEWNHAAENCTGINRSDAIGKEIWDIQARIAPAVVPYEEALSRSRDQFLSLVTLNDRNTGNWKEEYDWDILSTRGELRHVKTEVFPLMVRDHLIIVSILCNASVTEHLSKYSVQSATGS